VSNLDSWIMGVLSVLFGLGGLFLASRATDGMFQFLGLVLFVWSYLFVMRLINGGARTV